MANGTRLALMAVYAASSVALGLKASNLTHRGIVSRGPYAWVRHPADTCKNLAWWIGSIPLAGQAFAAGWLDGLMAAGSVAGWTALYVLRALTEEDHLRSVDGDYAAYARRVRYRFITASCSTACHQPRPYQRCANTPSPVATLAKRSPRTMRASGKAVAMRWASRRRPVEPPVK